MTTPEPSTVLGLIAVGLSSIVGFKGKKKPK
ncbi:PEP-CTERM sorting domain-containing protein [Microcystis sp. 0824]|nr:PEP-CTERM sorting domain-containing protein [Microcystis sp. 0824]